MIYRPIAKLMRPVNAVVRLPGSKSITNRALVVAALAKGVSRLSGALDAEDTLAMRQGVSEFGANIDDTDDPWLVQGTDGKLTHGSINIDAGASGTTARFLMGMAALTPGPVELDGSPRMRQRPIGELGDALATLGSRVEYLAVPGHPPAIVSGGERRGGSVIVDASRSSQFASALLMIGPLLSDGLSLGFKGEVASRPYLHSTIEVMRRFGAVVEETGSLIDVKEGNYRKVHFEVEADASAAVYPLVAAAITGGTVKLAGIPQNSVQPDLRVLEVLSNMGCEVRRTTNEVELTGPTGGELLPVVVDMAGAPDASLAVATAAMFATGPSHISGLSTLRIKESDRLQALVREINRLGAGAQIVGDELVIEPGNLRGGRVETYNDHRLAMSFAIAGLRLPGIEIADPASVNKTWPGFWEMLESL